MLLIKVETPVNPIPSTIKQISEEETVRLHTEELNKLRRAKDERNATAHPVQKASIDKLKEEKMNFETMFTQTSPPPTNNGIKSQFPPPPFVPPREMRKKISPLFLSHPSPPPRF